MDVRYVQEQTIPETEVNNNTCDQKPEGKEKAGQETGCCILPRQHGR